MFSEKKKYKRFFNNINNYINPNIYEHLLCLATDDERWTNGNNGNAVTFKFLLKKYSFVLHDFQKLFSLFDSLLLFLHIFFFAFTCVCVLPYVDYWCFLLRLFLSTRYFALLLFSLALPDNNRYRFGLWNNFVVINAEQKWAFSIGWK